MPDENGTETVRSEIPGGNDSPFGDAQDDAPATVVDEGDSGEETGQDPEGSDDSGDGTAQPDELKVVVSSRGGRATIGVQQPSSDPHIESFENTDLPALAQEIPAVTERARTRWEEAPKHPAYERPAPPAKRRNNRRQQGTAQNANAQSATEQEEAQQTLRLF